MITIRYCPEGEAVSDFAVEGWWRRVLAYDTSVLVRVSTTPPVTRARVAVCERELPPTAIQFEYQGRCQYPDSNGRLSWWPDGFCDITEKLSESLLAPKRCPACGELEFWHEAWQLYVCMSWKRMEGGCDPRGEIRRLGL